MGGNSVFLQHPNRKGPVLIDDLTKTLAIIPVSQCQLHIGRLFGASLFNEAVVGAASVDVLLRVSSLQDMYLDIFFSATGDTLCEMFEAPTTSADGTSLPLTNRNSTSAIVPATLAFTGPTITSPGTRTSVLFVPGGSGGNSPGAALGSVAAAVLSEGDWLMRVTNRTGQAQDINTILTFYEGKVT